MMGLTSHAARVSPRIDRAMDATTAPPIDWLHVCNGLDPHRDGGMVPSILGLTGALAQERAQVAIATATPSRLNALRVPSGVAILDGEPRLEDRVRSAAVVHLHGLWQAQTRRGARAAIAARVPYLIAAHGMADPWALRQKYWKKRIYRMLIESRNLRGASCLHALSRPEIEHLRALSPRTPIGFIPNGVDVAPFDHLPARSELETEHPELRDRFVILFFARLHAKKGLDLLPHALRSIAREHPNVHLLMAGTDEGELASFQSAMEDSGLSGRYTYLGHVNGMAAHRVWAAADAFILPSYSEGFSMAILEAMACQLPCLITTACYFPEASAAGAAITVHPDREGVSRGLRELLERTPRERQEMGRNARRLVERDYTWDRQAERLASIYQWLAGGGTRPDAVEP